MADTRSRIEKLMAMAKQDASPRERDTARDILGKMGLWPEHDPRVAAAADLSGMMAQMMRDYFGDDTDGAAEASAKFAAFARSIPIYEMHTTAGVGGVADNLGTRFHVTSIRYSRGNRTTSRTANATRFTRKPFIFDEQA